MTFFEATFADRALAYRFAIHFGTWAPTKIVKMIIPLTLLRNKIDKLLVAESVLRSIEARRDLNNLFLTHEVVGRIEISLVVIWWLVIDEFHSKGCCCCSRTLSTFALDNLTFKLRLEPFLSLSSSHYLLLKRNNRCILVWLSFSSEEQTRMRHRVKAVLFPLRKLCRS